MHTNEKKKNITHELNKIADAAKILAEQIHGFAEQPLQEYRSSKSTADFLAKHGFDVQFCFKNLPTAFRAERGNGHPIVGILGEYDALPDCGRKKGEWGHGCGHNLLGTAGAAGAIAAANIIQKNKIKGKIIYYGCPAEETLVGKAYMARDGAFRDLDVSIAWHPESKTHPSYHGGSAVDSITYEFFGKTCHAANPVNGKSAIDAAIIFDIAVNYLRESIPENVRIHSIIVKGGEAPNVVPEYAKSWYYIRAKDRAQVDEIRKRVDDCARGAAIATQTRYKSRTLTSIYNRLPNDAMFEIITDNLKLFGPPRATSTDRANLKKLGIKSDFEHKPDLDAKNKPLRSSTDEDTVSWLAPMGRFTMATHALNTIAHHRQLAAQMTLPFAIRGMMQAASVIAGSTIDIVSTPGLLGKIRAEFKNRTRGFKFDPLIPKGQKPSASA